MSLFFPREIWNPSFPKEKDRRITFSNEELQTIVVHERVGVAVNDVELDSPACFCTSSGNLYARLNWGEWRVISKSNKSHAASIRAAHFCRITLSQDNDLKDFVAPVYHVDELPAELFGASADPDRVQRKMAALAQLKDSMPKEVDAAAFANVFVDYGKIDLVVNGGDTSLVFAVFPEEDDLAAIPLDGSHRESGPDAKCLWPELLDALVNQREAVAELDDEGTTARAAIIASPDTIASMREAWGEELINKDIDLVEFSDFADYVMEYMPPLEENGDDEEEAPLSSGTSDDEEDDDDNSVVALPPFSTMGRTHILERSYRLEAAVREIQGTVNAQVHNRDGRMLARFRPETLDVDNGFPFDILLVGGHSLAAVYMHIPGEWMADDTYFPDHPAPWFSDIGHVVSPVHYGQACRAFFNGKIPDLKMDVVVILPKNVSIMNEDEMVVCWRERCHVSVARTRRMLDSSLPILRKCLPSPSEPEASPPQIDPSAILAMAKEFADDFRKQN